MFLAEIDILYIYIMNCIFNIYVSVEPTLLSRPRIEFSQQDCLPDNNRAALMMVMGGLWSDDQ